jgi:hypothetical protein
MNISLTFSVPELQLIIKAVEISDPMKLYAQELLQRIIKEANEQIAKETKEEPIKEDNPTK